MRHFGLALVILLSPTPLAAEEYFGKFPEGPQGRFVDGEERPGFELTKDFWFEDPNSVIWMTPKGTVVDGASIPQPFWSIIGGPFEGSYLKASVIHDYFCHLKSKTAHDTHRNFYYGMRANGVPGWQAKTMHWAVATFGPDWIIEKRIENSSECLMSPDGHVTCSSVPRIVEGVKMLPSADLQDPEVLSVALGKLNAIARTLKTTNGESLDVTNLGQVDASFESIEANAASFRTVMASETFKVDPGVIGILAEPTPLRFDEIESWPQNKLPTVKSSTDFQFTKPGDNAPFVLKPGDVTDFKERLNLSPMKFEMNVEQK